MPSDRLVAAGVFLAAGVAYALTALRGPGQGDTAKFAFVGHVLGIPHATGYPLYVLVSHVWAAIPVGSLATRVNMLSGACAAATVAAVFAILRTLEVRCLPAAAASLLFAFTPTLWSQAVIAEVYTLQTALMSLAILSWTRWWKTTDNRWAVAGIALLAAGMGNHMMGLTLVPAAVFLLWRERRRISASMVKQAAACALLPIALYFTLYAWTEIRPSVYLEAPVGSWSDFVRVITGRDFGGAMFANSPANIFGTQLPMIWHEFGRQFGWLIPIIAVGFLALRRNHRTIATYLTLVVITDLFVVVNYKIHDIFIYLLPAWIVATVALGAGLDAMLAGIRVKTAGVACAVAACVLPLWPLTNNWRHMDQSDGLPVSGLIRDAIAAVPDHAILMSAASSYETTEIVWYFLLGEGIGERRDIGVYYPSELPDVCRYLRNGAPLDTTWRRAVHRYDDEPTPMDERPPVGLPVYILDGEGPYLATAGFTLVPAGGGVSQVLPPASCSHRGPDFST